MTQFLWKVSSQNQPCRGGCFFLKDLLGSRIGICINIKYKVIENCIDIDVNINVWSKRLSWKMSFWRLFIFISSFKMSRNVIPWVTLRLDRRCSLQAVFLWGSGCESSHFLGWNFLGGTFLIKLCGGNLYHNRKVQHDNDLPVRSGKKNPYPRWWVGVLWRRLHGGRPMEPWGRLQPGERCLCFVGSEKPFFCRVASNGEAISDVFFQSWTEGWVHIPLLWNSKYTFCIVLWYEDMWCHTSKESTNQISNVF